MGKLNIFKITSEAIDVLRIPMEANMHYLKESNSEAARKKIEQHLISIEWIERTDKVTIEEFEMERPDFNINLFEEPNLKILCYLGFAIPRKFNGKKIYYGNSALNEFGNWGTRENVYYSQEGEYERTEKIE